MAIGPKKDLRRNKKGRAIVDTSKIAKNPDKGLSPSKSDLDMMEAESNVRPVDDFDKDIKDLRSKQPRVVASKAVPRKIQKKEKEIAKQESITLLEEQATPEQKVDIIAQSTGKTKEEVVKEDKKSGGLSDQFKMALSNLAPRAVGMLVGGLIAGNEGAVAGYREGTAVGKDLQEMQLKGRELESKRRYADIQQQQLDAKTGKQTAQLNLIHKETGEVLKTDYEGRVVDSSGNEVSPDKYRNLRDEAQQRLLRQGDERIQQREATRGLQKEKFSYKVGEDFQKDARNALKDVRGTEEYKSATKVLNEVPTIKALVDDAYNKGGQSLAMLGPKIAKGIAGEVGVLTEQDVTRYVKNPELAKGLMDTYTKMNSGKLTGASRENILRLLDIMEKKANDKLSMAVEREATLLSRREGVDKGVAKSLIDSNTPTVDRQQQLNKFFNRGK